MVSPLLSVGTRARGRIAGAVGLVLLLVLLPTVAFAVPGLPAVSVTTGGEGEQTYTVPASINVDDFNEVYVWCRRFSVPLGVAALN